MTSKNNCDICNHGKIDHKIVNLIGDTHSHVFCNLCDECHFETTTMNGHDEVLIYPQIVRWIEDYNIIEMFDLPRVNMSK